MSYAVYTIRDAATGEALYVGMTGNLRRRLAAHSRKPWAIGSVASAVTCTDRTVARQLEASTIFELQPRYNTYLKKERQHRKPTPVDAGAGTLNGRVAGEIRAHLARLDWKKSDLARVLSVSMPTARARWSGAQPYNLDELECIALALDVPVMSLFPEVEQGAAA